MTIPNSWTVTVEEDPTTGDLILPFPPELLLKQGWVDGDILEWKPNADGTWSIYKVDE